jgi:hypothetical protein
LLQLVISVIHDTVSKRVSVENGNDAMPEQTSGYGE